MLLKLNKINLSHRAYLRLPVPPMASHLTTIPSTGRDINCINVPMCSKMRCIIYFLLRVSRVPHRIAPRPSLAAQIAAKIETSAPRFVFQSAQIKQRTTPNAAARVVCCTFENRGHSR